MNEMDLVKRVIIPIGVMKTMLKKSVNYSVILVLTSSVELPSPGADLI